MILIPKNCPSCGSLLKSSGLELFCMNSEDCPAQCAKHIQNFTKTMKIKGFGEKTIESLLDAGSISNIPSLYYITESDLIDTCGVAIGTKLFNELNASRTQKLEIFIEALGIRSLGKSSGKVIAQTIGSLSNFNKEYLDTPELLKKLGTVKYISLMSFLDTELCAELLNLDLDLQSPKLISSINTQGVVCITGKLKDFPNRKVAEDYLSGLGWSVKSSVTKEVTHLICEDDSKKSSSSYKKALDRGIPITTIKNLTS